MLILLMDWTLLSLVKVSMSLATQSSKKRGSHAVEGKTLSPLPLNSEIVGQGREKCSDPQCLSLLTSSLHTSSSPLRTSF